MLDNKNDKIKISIIIPTYNRSDYLPGVLDSLFGQVVKESFEVIIIDDGSTDKTKEVVLSYVNKMPIKYFFQKNSGISTAKNHGIFVSKGELLLFLDDDDVISPNLLQEHINIHNYYKEKNYAVLGYTEWHNSLNILPLMEFVVGDGGFLFSYNRIVDGSILDYKYFWGGRSSCKRSFLVENGVFNQIFRFGCEDIELGYRLQQKGLRVVYDKKAISYMVRSINFDGFLKRLYKQGQSSYLFYKLYKNTEIGIYTDYFLGVEIWPDIKDIYDKKLIAIRKINDLVNERLSLGLTIDKNTLSILHDSYKWIFIATKIKGVIDARESDKN